MASPDSEILPVAVVSGISRSAVLFWTPLLLLDLLLLVLLRQVVWVALAVGSVVALVLLLRHPRFGLVFAAFGYVLLEPLTRSVAGELPVFILGRFIILIPLLAEVWNRLWDYPGGRRERVRYGIWSEPATRWGFVLGGILVLNSFWTPSPMYALFKVSYYFLDNMLLFFSAAILLRGRTESEQAARGRHFLGAIVVVELVIAGTAVWNWFTMYYPFSTRLVTLGVNPVFLGREMAFGLLALLTLERMGRTRWFWSVPAGLLFLWVIYQSGSRGPILALIAALAFWIGSSPGRAWRRLRPIVIGLILVAGVIGVIFLPQIAAEYITPLAGRGASNAIRLHLLELAREALSECWPWGIGTGGFTSLLKLGDVRFFPHNIFVEIGLENGIPGLIVWLGWLAAAILCWKRGQARLGKAIVSSDARIFFRSAGTMLLFSFVVAQVSGDIITNNRLWLWLGALLAWTSWDFPPKPEAGQ